MSVLSKLIVAVTAARALTIQQPLRLTPCLAINPPSIPAPTLPTSISRHPAIVLLNRVLLEPSECEAAAEDELVARLSPDDPRTIHVREHLKAESGQELRAGLLDAGATDSAQLEWVASEARDAASAIENTETIVELELDLLRNRILRTELLFTLFNTLTAVAAMVTGLFGMNLVSHWESSPRAFWAVTTALVGGMGSGWLVASGTASPENSANVDGNPPNSCSFFPHPLGEVDS